MTILGISPGISTTGWVVLRAGQLDMSGRVNTPVNWTRSARENEILARISYLLAMGAPEVDTVAILTPMGWHARGANPNSVPCREFCDAIASVARGEDRRVVTASRSQLAGIAGKPSASWKELVEGQRDLSAYFKAKPGLPCNVATRDALAVALWAQAENWGES